MWLWTSYPTRSLAEIATNDSVSENKNAPSYDFVIVGGGTAGCALASRLSEDPKISVLLLERGPVVNTWASRIPLVSSDFRVSSAPAHKWTSESIESLGGRDFAMVSGKALGGTSKINAHLYTRSVPGEYNAWAKAGRKGWSYDELEPYFSRSEKSLTHGNSRHRGSTGVWKNQRLDEIYFENIAQTIKATTALGIPYVTEANAPDEPVTACTRVDMTIDSNSRRQSTFDAFLPAHIATERSDRLTICVGVVATSIDIRTKSESLKAVGVYLEDDSPTASKKRYYVRAGREVILCSGAIATPQLLMLSGIGPKEHLKEMGISVVQYLPGVGSHLQDHYGVSVSYRVPRNDTMHRIESSPLVALWEFLKYLTTGKGLFLSPNPQLTIFARSALLDEEFRTIIQDPSQVDARDPANIPDIEIMPIPYLASDYKLDIQKDGAFSLLCALLRPASTGTVRLTSTDPRSRPACDLKFLSEKDDYVVLRAAVGLALQIGRQMREQGYPLRDLQVPQNESDSAMDKFIRHAGRTTFHYSSTCRMAPQDDPAPGVVDDELRVHGVQGLRIADASVFPSIPATHLQAPTVMLAEKCADFLKAAYK